ncbi:MAG: ABC transporter substrate-binding protein, partial [Candidatus Taylorbacteria bacterium]
MTPPQHTKEFRFKHSSRILAYISAFSETERVIFGFLILILGFTSIALATSVNKHFLTEIPARGGELHEGIIGLPRTVNPVLAVTDTDRDITSLVYSGLTHYTNGTFVDDLALSHTISDDGLTYTFTLKPNLYFQDGTPLTTDDVAFTIQKIQDPTLKSPRRMDWANVTTKVVSPAVIQFILKQPYSPFLSNTTIGIIPKHIWGSVTDDQFIFSQYNIQPIGSGPYEITNIARDTGGIPTTYTLGTWGKYYGTTPFITTISLNFFGDETSAFAALDGGSIDSMASLSPLEATKLASEKAQSYSVISTPLPRIFGVFFNQNQNPILADKNVRQALDLAVDRSEIIQKVLAGYGTPLHGPLPPGMTSSATSDTNSLDLTDAMTILEKSGWKKGSDGIYVKTSKDKKTTQTLSFDLYTADTSDLKQTADLLKANWAQLGVQVNVKVFETSDLYQNVIRPRKYDALLFGELIGKDRDLYAFWHSSQRNAPGLNVSLYTNTKTDKLLEDIRSTQDDTTRLATYTQFDQIIRADIPALFLYAPDFIYAIPKSVHHISLGTMTTRLATYTQFDQIIRADI